VNDSSGLVVWIRFRGANALEAQPGD